MNRKSCTLTENALLPLLKNKVDAQESKWENHLEINDFYMHIKQSLNLNLE